MHTHTHAYIHEDKYIKNEFKVKTGILFQIDMLANRRPAAPWSKTNNPKNRQTDSTSQQISLAEEN